MSIVIAARFTYERIASTVRGITEIIWIDTARVVLAKSRVDGCSRVLVSEVLNIGLQVPSSAVDHLLNVCLRVCIRQPAEIYVHEPCLRLTKPMLV
jgi:hypothetical protein